MQRGWKNAAGRCADLLLEHPRFRAPDDFPATGVEKRRARKPIGLCVAGWTRYQEVGDDQRPHAR